MPKLCLINRMVCPPDGFRYTHPEDGYLSHGWTYDAWVEVAHKHYSANKQPSPPDLETRMQEQLCKTLPPGWCLYDDPNRPRPSVSLGWNDMARGVEVFTRWTIGGRKTVPQEEAERRAEICSRCYLNVNVQGCSACQQAVAAIVGDRVTKADHALRSCAVCKCFLRAKVHFPKDLLDTESNAVQEQYPEFCWMKETP